MIFALPENPQKCLLNQFFGLVSVPQEAVDKIEDFLRRTRGIEAVLCLQEEDRLRLMDIETEAEKKAFMGLGMCYNSGIRDVLRCPLVFVCITSMDFDWG